MQKLRPRVRAFASQRPLRASKVVLLWPKWHLNQMLLKNVVYISAQRWHLNQRTFGSKAFEEPV